MELMNCPELAVPKEVMRHVVQVESSYNPYAIGVVGGHLVRQPKNLREALATVRMLEREGYNFSLGLAQVNRHNLRKYGLDSYEKAFQACPNLQAGSRILAECHDRSGGDWGKSFSCYYSGDFSTGFRHGYVQKVYASMRASRDAAGGQSTGPAIEVARLPSPHEAGVSRLPADSRPARRYEPASPPSAAPRTTSRLAAATAPQPYLPAGAIPVPAPAQSPVPVSAVDAQAAQAARGAVRVQVMQPVGGPGAAPSSEPDLDRAFVF